MTYNLYLLGFPSYFYPSPPKVCKVPRKKLSLRPTSRKEKKGFPMNSFSLNKGNNTKQNRLIKPSTLFKPGTLNGLSRPFLFNSKKEKTFFKNKVVPIGLSGAGAQLRLLSGAGAPLKFLQSQNKRADGVNSRRGLLSKASLSSNLAENHFNKNTYWNQCFDKGRFKNFVLWFFLNNGEHKTVQLVEQFKTLGFEYATKAGISLGIEDLKIPPKKSFLIFEAEKETAQTVKQYQRGDITGVERFQRLIDTWHRTSEQLKQEVIDHFEATDILNPVYMMAFSGARGNISQVRQLVGMRGLMANPQGQIIDFPIRSNFREGLTLTEYIISSYGARKGIVDTALRTANAGYLTRRLVDVAQHVIISNFDCGTRRGIFLTDMKEGNKTILSLQTRLVGRVCARDIFVNEEKIAKRNNEISIDLAFQINKVTKKVFVRSALTCETKKLVCQLCYGWSLAQGNLVSIGEAIGVIAAQSIGEPGTQLTMRTFHTGGVFSGDISDQIRMPFTGIVNYISPIPGTLIRTPEGKIAFLTKSNGSFTISNLTGTEKKKYKIPEYTLLFGRHGEIVVEKEVVAQISSISKQKNATDDAELTIKSEIEGQFYLQHLQLKETKVGPKQKDKEKERDMENVLSANTDYLKSSPMDSIFSAWNWGNAWILSGKVYHSSFPSHFFPQIGDFLNRQSSIVISKGNSSFSNVSGFIKLERPTRSYPKYSIPYRLLSLNKPYLEMKLLQEGSPESQSNENSSNQSYSPKNNSPIYNFEFLSFPLSSISYKKVGYFAKITRPFISSFGKQKNLKKSSEEFKSNKFINKFHLPFLSGGGAPLKTPYHGSLNSDDSLFIIPPNAQVRFTRGAFSQKSLVNLYPTNWQPNFNVVLQWFPSYFKTKTSGLLIPELSKEGAPLRFWQSQNRSWLDFDQHSWSNVALKGPHLENNMLSFDIQLARAKSKMLLSEAPDPLRFRQSLNKRISINRKNPLSSISISKNHFIKQKMMCLTKSQIFINFTLNVKKEKNITFTSRNKLKLGNNLLPKEKNTTKVSFGTKALSPVSLNKKPKENLNFSRLFFIGQNNQSPVPSFSFIGNKKSEKFSNFLCFNKDLEATGLNSLKRNAFRKNLSSNELLNHFKKQKSTVIKLTSKVLESKNKSKNESIIFFNNLSAAELSGPPATLQKSNYKSTILKSFYWPEVYLKSSAKLKVFFFKFFPSRETLSFDSFGVKKTPLKSKLSVALKEPHLKFFLTKTRKQNLNFLMTKLRKAYHLFSEGASSSNSEFLNLNSLFWQSQNLSYFWPMAKNLSGAKPRLGAPASLKKGSGTKKNKWIYYISQTNLTNESRVLNLNCFFQKTMHASLAKKIFYPGQAINSELVFDQHIVNIEPIFIRLNEVPSSFESCEEDNLSYFEEQKNFKNISFIVENRVVNNKCRYKLSKPRIKAAELNGVTRENFEIAFNIKKVDEFFLNSLNTNKESLNIKNEIYQLCQFYENPMNSLSTFSSKFKFLNHKNFKSNLLKSSHLDVNLQKKNRSILIKAKGIKNRKAFLKMIFNKTFISFNEIQKLKNSFFNKQKLSPQLMSKYPSVDINIISNFSKCFYGEKSKEFHLFSFFVTLPSFRSIFEAKIINPSKTILCQPKSNLSYPLNKLKESSYPFKEYKFDFSAPIISSNSIAKLSGNKTGSNLLFSHGLLRGKQEKFAFKNQMSTKQFLKNALINQSFSLLNTFSLFKSPFLSTSLIHKLEPSFSFKRNSNLVNFEGRFCQSQNLCKAPAPLRKSFHPVRVKFKVNQFVSGQYFSSLIPFAKTYLYSPFEGEVLDITSPPYHKKTLLGSQATEGLANFSLKNTLNSFNNKKKFSELIQKESTFLQIKQHTSIILTKGDLISFYFPISNFKPTSYSEGLKFTQSYIVKDGLVSLTSDFLKNEETKTSLSPSENEKDQSQFREIENFHIYKLPQIVSGFIGLKKTKTSRKRTSMTKAPLLHSGKQNSFFVPGNKKKQKLTETVLFSQRLNLSVAPAPLKKKKNLSKPSLALLKKENYKNRPTPSSVLAFLLGDFIVSGDSLILNSSFPSKENLLVNRDSLNRDQNILNGEEAPLLFSQRLNKRNGLKKEQESKMRSAVTNSGQIIHLNKEKITIRKGQPLFVSPKAILHKFDGDFIDPKSPVITLSYQRLKTGDIVQGIPKIEQFFEARTTKRGRLFRDSLPNLLKALFKRYLQKLPLDKAVRQSFYKIQQIIVDGVLRVYRSQGVTIADKHLEIIVKQMTSKVRILEGGQTGFFPGEIVDLDFVEQVNQLLMKKIQYEPLVLGITKSSLEVDSFLSAASFQQTTRVLSGAAIARKKDFLKGLKENVILGNLIPAGTGYLVFLNDTSSS